MGAGIAVFSLVIPHRTASHRNGVLTMESYDIVGAMMAYESGEMDAAEIVELFSHLVKNGLAWSLQGHYGRMAGALIEAKILAPNGDILFVPEPE